MSQKSIEIRIAGILGISETKANETFNAVIDALKDEIADMGTKDNLVIRNFGTYRKAHQEARIARNPATGEPVNVPAKTVLKFKPAKQMQEAVA